MRYTIFLGVILAATGSAQAVDSNMMLHPPADSWLTFHGDYSGRRNSSLTQITPQNVGQLKEAWRFQTDRPTRRSKPRPFWSMEFCISPRRIISGRSMRAPASNLAL